MLFPLLFDLIVYWMAGLANTPEQFLIFYLITVLASFAGSSVGLLIGSIADAKNISAMGPIFMMPFILFSGFFKNRSNLPVWIGWI